ncbi:MAG: enoyl-CoA hydratase/isomerase family protein [Xanthobacteraceae bacterium]|nr:enoyl-CoA hydratase/isomerase family protein [Xanthobacteraceae bacterium]
MGDEILSAEDGDILRVTINRPEAGNAMTDPMAVELTRIIAGAPATSRMVLLRGAGADFCVGRQSPPPPPIAPEAMERRRFSDIVFDAYGAIRNSPIPVVCVVQGRALGFGCAVAAVADITIATEDATFQVPEMLHNILPTMVMSALADRATRKALSYLVYSAKAVSAARALCYGIVSDVVPRAALEAEVTTLCENILQAPAIATEGVKDYLRHALTLDIPAAVDYARNLHAVVNSSREIRPKR